MYLHGYGKSGFEIATNTVAFAIEFFPLRLRYLEESPICDQP